MAKIRHLRVPCVLVLLLAGAGVARADIICNPGLLGLDTSTPTGVVVVTYTGGGSANVAGFSLDVTWNHTLAAAAFTRPDAAPFSGAATFFVVNLGAGHVRVDGAIGGADPGIASGELFKATFTALPGVSGTSALDLTIVQLRDPANQAVTDGVAVDGQLAVDTGAPVIAGLLIANATLPHTDDYVKDTDLVTVTAQVTDDDPGFGAAGIVADLTALGGGAAVGPDSWAPPVATWNLAAACSPADGTLTVTVTATDGGGNASQATDTIIADNTPPTPLLGLSVLPGHEKLHLSWTAIAGNDANPLGVEFRQAAWGDYPKYDAAAPAYPADRTQGAPALQATGTNAVDWAVTPRDIYYVAGFVYDMVLHYSAAGAANTGRATNYWLGDVGGAAGVDGSVDIIHDINRLADTYGLPDTDGGFDDACDVGPTDTGSPRGIPQPNGDHEVGFEDMMVFALNYTVVSPATKNLDLSDPVLAWARVDDTTWSLALAGGGGRLQGLHVRADLPDGVACTVSAGSLLAGQASPVLVSNAARRGLAAGLGVFGRGGGIVGVGELMRVQLTAPLADLPVEVVARDADNRPLELRWGGAGGPAVPGAAGFAPNFPNPFNPGTMLVFELARPGRAALTIHGLDGARVRALLDAECGAGRQEVFWDGRDDQGRSLAAGAYVARIVAGEFEQTRKLMLVK